MKRLILVRHAKSDWGDFKIKDFDRPLNNRGHKNAPEMAQRLLEKVIIPDAVISSPALRAITTANYFCSTWQLGQNQLTTSEEIYEAPLKNLLKVVNSINNKHETIALFGHNPGLSNLVVYLTGKSFFDMPTCSVAIIDFAFDEWQMISHETGDLFHFDFPKSGQD